jgi:dolichol-phosphate mannosyltransferase
MPVFNEQDSIQTVVRSWFETLDQTVGNFSLVAINDGSTDGTEAILQGLIPQLGPRLEMISRPNRGHGQTCMQGYRLAWERKIPHVLQIDSDGQSDPSHFPAFWDIRDQYDVIYGRRSRKDGIRRVIASRVLKTLLRHHTKADCIDANVPYRLMNTSACAVALPSIPADFNLANIALAVVLRKNPSIRHGEVPIGFPPRLGGEPSVPFSKFALKARELFQQLAASGISDS